MKLYWCSSEDLFLSKTYVFMEKLEIYLPELLFSGAMPIKYGTPMGLVKRISAFEHAQNAPIKIILPLCKV